MKQIYPLLILAALVVGCSKEESDSELYTGQTTVEAVGDVFPVSPAITTPRPFDPLAAPAEVSHNESVPLVTDAEERVKLADLTENIYLQWNAALEEYRKEHNRLPRTLLELQQFHPELASLQPPRGFALTLDPQAGEVFIVRAQPAKAPSSQPANQRPPPLAIP